MSFIDFEKERVRRDEIAESNLMDAGLVSRKKQAQKALKYHLRIGTLFTLSAWLRIAFIYLLESKLICQSIGDMLKHDRR